MERIYVETTVISYLTARPSRDVVIAGHQQITHDWWDEYRGYYELCASPLVRQEAADGDPLAAQDRMGVLAKMTILETRKEAILLAEALVREGAVPVKAAGDALHVAFAAVHIAPYLLTWNCRHLANATLRTRIEAACKTMGFKAPIICTPEEMMEERS